jgi:fatty acid synthase subunit alpha
VLLNKQRIERIIEIGPADTLVSMAKKTLSSRYQQMDTARHIKRKLLYYGKDSQEIYYEGEQIPEQSAKKTPPPTPKIEASKQVVALPQPVVIVQTPPPSAAPSQVADAPVSAKEIVITIIALKLKKNCEEIPLTKNIKQLVGGEFPLNC